MPKKNGFLMFALEWKERNGRSMSLSEATTQAGKIWENMNSQQRRPYNDKAKRSNQHITTEKMTCTGTPISHVQNQKHEEEDKLRIMKRTIEAIVRNSVVNDEIQKKTYFFIMVNHFTRKINNGDYVPAELSISEYSLKEGVTRKYHTFINPGDDNMYGLKFEAKQLSDTTHQLPLPPNALGERNLGKIYTDIMEFLQDDKGNVKAPLFTLSDSIPVVESVLKFLSDYHELRSKKLDIYSIQYLFFILKENTCKVGQLEKPSSHYITDAFFAADRFDYQSGISCAYHEEIDKTKYCTQSYVTRWGYMFSDYMCQDVAILPVPGRHIPKDYKHGHFGAIGGESMYRDGDHYKNHMESSGNSINTNRRTSVSHKEILPGQAVGIGAKKKMTTLSQDVAFSSHNNENDCNDDDDQSVSTSVGWTKASSLLPGRQTTPRRPNTDSFILYNEEEKTYSREYPSCSNRRALSYNLPENKKSNGRHDRK